jgi:hypothetical protein
MLRVFERVSGPGIDVKLKDKRKIKDKRKSDHVFH